MPDAQLWETGVGHTGGLSDKPAEYENRVIAFLDATLSADR
jgi:hypothetical protein